MDLSVRQTRQLLLAGTVAIPRPFPSVGIISYEGGSVIYDRSRGPEGEDFIVVQRRTRRRGTMVYGVRPADVRAIFVPGRRLDEKRFRISRRRWARDFDRGEWFFGEEIAVENILKTLGLEDERRGAETRESVLRGIVFVRANRPIVRHREDVLTAHELQRYRHNFCTGCWEHEPPKCTPERCTPD